MPRQETPDSKVIGLCGALCAAIFAADLFIPLGVAAGVPYIAPVLISYRASTRRYILIVAVVGSALTLLGYLLSPSGGVPWMVATNRGLALAAIWITALLAYGRRHTGDALRRSESTLSGALETTSDLRRANKALEDEIAERKREEQRRHRAEERLRDAVESIADGFILFDADDRVVMWNQRFADMYPELAPLLPARPTAEDMFRERYRAGAVGTFDVPAEQYVQWRMEMRRKQGGTPAVHRHRDGRWFRTTERPTTDGGVVAISTDVTELKGRELDLLEAIEQTEFANRAKSEFLANMSHELRTPLNAVIGFSEMISSEMFGPIGHPRYKEYAEDIHASGTHLLGIISELLDLSKIEAGKTEIEECDLIAADVVDSAVRLVADRAEAAAVELTSHVADDLPRLRADERAVKQILLNLLSNAIKFTPAGGKVTTWVGLDAKRRFVLSVSDTGIGIAENDIGQAMAPFGQIENSLTRTHVGSGLGLPLVEGLVGLHGGTFELASEIGVGTTATVRFPADRAL